jgi:hypothetical protein
VSESGDRPATGEVATHLGLLRRAGRRGLDVLRRRLVPELPEIRFLLQALHDRIVADGAATASDRERQGRELERIKAVLRSVQAGEWTARQRLRALRAGPDYAEPFEAEDPLVSIVIPTYDSVETLIERALPSALGQTYRNVEVVIVGDGSPPEVAAAVEEVADERVRFHNLERRGPYPDDPMDRWYIAGAAPRNEAVWRARGLWIAQLDDDDAFTPEHVEGLLGLARQDGAEVAYGRLRLIRSGVPSEDLGVFPPQYGQFGWQAALFHRGLRDWDMDLTDAVFEVPADWGLCRRMLRAGVRFAMLDEVVVAKHGMQRFMSDADS